MLENDASSTDENGTESPPPAADAVAELKQELEKVKDLNNQLIGRIDQMSVAHPREIPTQPAPKQYTAEEYGNLLKTDPAKAVELAVESVVQNRVKPLVDGVVAKNDRHRWDSKAESEFPAMRTDREFSQAVSEQIKDLIEIDGRSKDDPTLLYRAAQLAAGKLGRKAAPPRGGISGEAPNSGGSPGAKGFKPPAYFDDFNKVFGLSEESKKRLLTKMEAQNKKGARR